jgi:hypothetical protein
MDWADKIEKRQEKASLEHIPQSIYDRAMFRLIEQKCGGSQDVAKALSAAGPDDDPMSIILGRCNTLKFATTFINFVNFDQGYI